MSNLTREQLDELRRLWEEYQSAESYGSLVIARINLLNALTKAFPALADAAERGIELGRRLLCDKDVADVLGLTTVQASRLMRKGLIPTLKLPMDTRQIELRCDPEDLCKWIKARKILASLPVKE
jgi:hypothetical protein